MIKDEPVRGTCWSRVDAGATAGRYSPVAVRWTSLVLCRGSKDTQGEGAREGAAGVIPEHSQ